MARYYIGTSGWVYPHWRGAFYPQGLAQALWLGYYASHFDTVELNNSFYRLPTEKNFQGWRDRVPPGFRFAVKASRFITHIKKLNDVAAPLATFLDRARLLGDKLGPILYQMPPNLHRNDERLSAFLALLPADMQHVIEFRHVSWLDEAVLDMLRRYEVGFCIFDMPGLECPVASTADFAYVRFHGSTGMYSSRYSERELENWAIMMERLAGELKEIYIFFNNDAGGFAVENAISLMDNIEKI